MQLPLPLEFADLTDLVDWDDFLDVDFLGDKLSQKLLPPTIQAIDLVLKSLENSKKSLELRTEKIQKIQNYCQKKLKQDWQIYDLKSAKIIQNQFGKQKKSKQINELILTKKSDSRIIKKANFTPNFIKPSKNTSKMETSKNIQYFKKICSKILKKEIQFEKELKMKNWNLVNHWQKTLSSLVKSQQIVNNSTLDHLKNRKIEKNLTQKLDLTGRIVAIIGQGKLVGNPLLGYFAARNATIISLNKDTPNKEKLVKLADIVIAASGVPNLVKSHWLCPNAIVIDAATSESGGVLAGDIDKNELEENSNFIKQINLCPSPGGIGPLTVLSIFWNLYRFWQSDLEF